MAPKYSLMSFLTGVLLIVFGIISVFVLSTKVTLSCVRGPRVTDQCEMTEAGIFRSQTQQIRLGDITGATVEQKEDWLRKRGRRTVYRVVLSTKSGPVPLTQGFSSGMTDHQRSAHQIAAFLKSDTTPSLQIVQNDTASAFLVGAILGGVGITLASAKARKSGD